MYDLIVVGTDGSETARTAVAAGARLAAINHAHLLIVTAFSARRTFDDELQHARVPEEARWRLTPGPEAEAIAQAAADDAVRAAGGPLKISTYIQVGHPADVLVAVAALRNADLVIVGNRGMTGLGRVTGSIGRAVASRAPCDVLIVDTTGRRQRARRSREGRAAARGVPAVLAAMRHR